MSDLQISVVTISYNNVAGLARTIKSVQAQSGAVQHVVVDGGSKDDSVQLLRASTVEWTSERDEGIYDALNIGTARASGDVVCWLNAGDTFTDGTVLSRIRESYARVAWEWAYGFSRQTRQGAVVGVKCHIPFMPRRFAAGLTWIPHQAVFMATRFARDLGPYRLDLDVVSDQEYLLRAAARAEPVVIPHFLCDYELDGAHTQIGAWRRAQHWRTARVASGLQFGPPIVDLGVTVAEASYRRIQATKSRIGRVLRPPMAEIANVEGAEGYS